MIVRMMIMMIMMVIIFVCVAVCNNNYAHDYGNFRAYLDNIDNNTEGS